MKDVFRVSCTTLAAAASVISWAINIRHDGNDADYRALARQPQFSMVGLVEIKYPEGGGKTGTGTFIGFGKGEAWVLTARHVMSGFGTKSRFRVGGRAFEFGEIAFYYNDMAVVPILGLKEGDLKPARFINHALPIPNRLEDRVVGTFVGYGETGTGRKPSATKDGQKRAGQQRIDGYKIKTYKNNGDVFQEFGGYMADFDDGTADSNTLDRTDNTKDRLGETQTSARAAERLEASLGDGDSGGPLFVEINKGGAASDWIIAGVNARQYMGDGYGSWVNFDPVDEEYSRWITEKTGINGVPEPASLAALSAGLLLLLARRRKRP